jgi:nucleoid-associated protein YgaU
MSNYRQRVCAAIAGAFLLASGTAWADKLDTKSVEQFQAQVNMAMQGDADAQYQVGEMYEQGLGTTRDLNLAFLWFNKASTQGNARAKAKLAAMDNKNSAETAKEQDRVNAAMRALQQQQDQELTKQKAAAARNRQADEAPKQKAAVEAAAAKARAEAAAKAKAPPVPAPAPAAKPAPKKEAEAEFSANPCKGPQAKFLSTCQ